MECFHEISYSHLSFKAMEHYSNINKMKLKKISGGNRFGIDYHKKVLYYPLPFNFIRGFVAWRIRTFIRLKSKFAYFGLRFKRKLDRQKALETANLYFQVECLRMSNGFTYIIQKEIAEY